jgi:hypothetical protein|tara:strand:+ start:50263 stop:50487 length:225 start_codon:yes stop_codon:yes gene_type:complete
MNTESSWKIVYKTDLSYRSEIIKQILDKNTIESISLNKIDSSYNNFGYYEVLVNELDYVEANKIIQKINFDKKK